MSRHELLALGSLMTLQSCAYMYRIDIHSSTSYDAGQAGGGIRVHWTSERRLILRDAARSLDPAAAQHLQRIIAAISASSFLWELMLLRKPTRIELKPEDKEARRQKLQQHMQRMCQLVHSTLDTLRALQYETVKKAQAEAQAKQAAESGQQRKFEQQQVRVGLETIALTALGTRRA